MSAVQGDVPKGTGPCFPSRFMKGVGISVWQNSSDYAPGSSDPSSGNDVQRQGNGTAAATAASSTNSSLPSSRPSTASKSKARPSSSSNWFTFAQRKQFFGQAGLKTAWQQSNNFWELYETHIKLARDAFGTNSFRFSFEWSRLEPTGPGMVDMAAVERYHTIIDTMIANGLEPMCTLHHFTHPQWFEDLGGFEKEENIPYFLEYSKRVFKWFGSKIKLWATFNEPTCFSFVGFIAGLWCPGKTMQFGLAGQVLFTLLSAHVEVYKALKAMPGGDVACIGLVHQHIRFLPKSKFTPHIGLVCKWMTYWFGAEVMLTFFNTGVFEWKVPLLGTTIRRVVPDAPKTLDWWGINYYSYPCISPSFTLGSSSLNEPVSDNAFRVYPQGLYESIVDASSLGRPMYVTETGSADREGRHRRKIIEGHCDMVLKSIREGYDVRGLYYWTLMDNIEWHEGFHMKFGLFEWDPEKSEGLQLQLRPGSEALKEAYKTWPEGVAEMKQFAADKHGWLASQQLSRGTARSSGGGSGGGGSGGGSKGNSPRGSPRVKSAWSDGKGLSERGVDQDSADGDQRYSTPGMVDDNSNDGRDLGHALTTSSIRLTAPDSNRASQNGAVGIGESIATRARSALALSALGAPSPTGSQRSGSTPGWQRQPGDAENGGRPGGSSPDPSLLPLASMREVEVLPSEADGPHTHPLDTYPKVWSTPAAITGEAPLASVPSPRSTTRRSPLAPSPGSPLIPLLGSSD